MEPFEADAHRRENRNEYPKFTYGKLLFASITVVVVAFVITLMIGFVGIPDYTPRPQTLTGTVTTSAINLVEQGLAPNEPNEQPNNNVHVIQLSLEHLRLLVGGTPIKDLRLAQPIDSLQGIAGIINEPSWLSINNGVATLNAALILKPQTSLAITSPSITRVVLANLPGVMLGAQSAKLSFSGVQVGASPPPAGGTVYRPFILAAESVMDAVNSKFSGLGYDTANSGVTWFDASFGTVTGTAFEGNFVGAAVNRSNQVDFRAAVFAHNQTYGLYIHSAATVNAADIVASNNASHGVVLSDGAYNSSIAQLKASNNGGDGLLIQRGCANITVQNGWFSNNHGDGIAVNQSLRTRIQGNTAWGNHSGVQMDTASSLSSSAMVTGNTLRGNVRAVRGFNLPNANRTFDNGDQLHAPTIRYIWLSAGAVELLLIVSALLLHTRHRRRYGREQGWRH